MHRYGLKLCSTNSNYLEEALRVQRAGVCSYLELFVVPGSYETHAGLWADLGLPCVIHAPHYDAGLNLALAGQAEQNLRYAREALRFADRLKSDTVIFHPGIEGEISETVRQLIRIGDGRIVIENKPFLGRDDVVCVGSTPDELRLILEATGFGFCLDIGHAICSANSHRVDPFCYLAAFSDLEPRLFHLTDGTRDGVYDEHLHIGEGEYDFARIFELLPEHAMITVETVKDSRNHLRDFESDIFALKAMGRKSRGVAP